MILEGQLAIGLLQFLLGCIPGNPEDFIVISLAVHMVVVSGKVLGVTK